MAEIAHSPSTRKKLATGLAPSLWGSADLLLRRPQSLCTTAPGPQLLHQHGNTGLQLPQGVGMVGTAQVAAVSHELLGRLVIAPAVKESTGTGGAAFQSLFQPAGGGNALLPSLSPLKARWGHGTPCPHPSPVPHVIRAKARGLAQSARYLPELLPTHLRSFCSNHSSLLQAPPMCPRAFAPAVPSAWNTWVPHLLRSLLKVTFLILLFKITKHLSPALPLHFLTSCFSKTINNHLTNSIS